MKIRKVSFLAVLTAILVLVSACGNTGTTESTEAEVAEDSGSYPVLKVSLLVGTDAPADLEMVQDKLNTVTEEQIGADIEFVPVRISDWSDTYMQLASKGEEPDLMMLVSGSANLSAYAENNLIVPLDDYMSSAGHTLVYFMGDSLTAGLYQEKQYGIPQITNRISANAKGFRISKSLCSQYGIEESSIKTVEDLEAAFELVHEKNPKLTILMPETTVSDIASSLYPYYDFLGTSFGVLISEEDGSCSVQCLSRIPEVQEAMETVHRWYEKGYIPQNVNITDEYGSDMVEEGTCFAAAVSSIGPEMGTSATFEVVLVDEKPLVTTDSDDTFIWTVSSQCEDPALAVSFLNLCYRDPQVSNLLRYGISGIHYKMLENGTLDTSCNSGYNNSWVQFGNIHDICFSAESYEIGVSTKNITTVSQLEIMYNEWETEYSRAYGFLFDPTEVNLELSACNTVQDKYYYPLMNGTVDPETELPKYEDALYEAGLQEVLDQIQLQLDAWVSSH